MWKLEGSIAGWYQISKCFRTWFFIGLDAVEFLVVFGFPSNCWSVPLWVVTFLLLLSPEHFTLVKAASSLGVQSCCENMPFTRWRCVSAKSSDDLFDTEPMANGHSGGRGEAVLPGRERNSEEESERQGSTTPDPEEVGRRSTVLRRGNKPAAW